MSRELFGADGFKTESVRYFSPQRGHAVYAHWWYDRGKPLKRIKRGQVVFDLTAGHQGD